MPHPTLGAIVIVAMLHLSKPGYLGDVLVRSRWEFAIAVIVVAGELTLGVLQGIALGVVLSLLLLIYRTSHPHGDVLGQVPGTEAYRNIQRHPEAVTFPGLLIWRPGGDLFFASIVHLGDGLKATLAASRPPTKRVLVDAEAVNLIDVSACDALLNIIRELQSQSITFAFARVRDKVRDRLRLGGVEALAGPAIPVPAIVSAELFDAAAEQLAENRKHLRQRQRGPSYLLQGPLRITTGKDASRQHRW